MDIKNAIGRMLHISRSLNRGHPNVTSEHFLSARARVFQIVNAKDAELARLRARVEELEKRNKEAVLRLTALSEIGQAPTKHINGVLVKQWAEALASPEGTGGAL